MGHVSHGRAKNNPQPPLDTLPAPSQGRKTHTETSSKTFRELKLILSAPLSRRQGNKSAKQLYMDKANKKTAKVL
jgi:hypothetical protein